MRWYVHILRTNEENKMKQTMKMVVRGTRAKGRPRMRWMEIRHDMNKCGLEGGNSQDRIRWRRMIQFPDQAL